MPTGFWSSTVQRNGFRSTHLTEKFDNFFYRKSPSQFLLALLHFIKYHFSVERKAIPKVCRHFWCQATEAFLFCWIQFNLILIYLSPSDNSSYRKWISWLKVLSSTDAKYGRFLNSIVLLVDEWISGVVAVGNSKLLILEMGKYAKNSILQEMDETWSRQTSKKTVNWFLEYKPQGNKKGDLRFRNQKWGKLWKLMS